MFQVFENASTIMKLRLGALFIDVITIITVYCQTGQKISDRVYIFSTENYTGIRHFLIIFRWKKSLTFLPNVRGTIGMPKINRLYSFLWRIL
jgi:hypothetical protein